MKIEITLEELISAMTIGGEAVRKSMNTKDTVFCIAYDDLEKVWAQFSSKTPSEATRSSTTMT